MVLRGRDFIADAASVSRGGEAKTSSSGSIACEKLCHNASVRERWTRLGLVIMALAISLRVALVWFEEKLIYFPSREIETTPDELGLPHEVLDLRASDGTRLSGWYLPAPGSEGERRVVLYCHGNAGNVSGRLDRAIAFHRHLRVDVMLFDYRGYGESEGRPSEEGTYRDARAAYTFLRKSKGFPPERIVLFGESLGAGVAVQLATEVATAALVLESPFTSIPDMAREVYPWVPFAQWVRTRYDNIEKIASVHAPLLVIHGTRDPTVPFAHGERLFRAGAEPKRLLAVDGAGHTDASFVAEEAYWRAWKDILR